MLKDKRVYTGRPLFVDGVAAAMGLVLARLARTKSPNITQPPTPEQIAARERADWNAEVARRKAEKQAKKGGQHGDTRSN